MQRKRIQAWFADYKRPTLQQLNFQTVLFLCGAALGSLGPGAGGTACVLHGTM